MYCVNATELRNRLGSHKGFARWLEDAPVKAARFLPMVRAEMRGTTLVKAAAAKAAKR